MFEGSEHSKQPYLSHGIRDGEAEHHEHFHEPDAACTNRQTKSGADGLRNDLHATRQ